MHMQTVSIISSLQLSWPPTVETTFDFFNLGAFQFSGLKPECLTDASSYAGLPLYYAVSLAKLTSVLGLHTLIFGGRVGAYYRRRPKGTDLAFLLGSFTYVLTYVLTVNVSLGVLYAHWNGDETADKALRGLALALLAADAAIILEQYVTVSTYVST